MTLPAHELGGGLCVAKTSFVVIVRGVARRPARLTRSAKVRTDGANLLLEGTGEDYGWVSNYARYGGTLGSYDPGGTRPSWWVGEDRFQPIGPNGPSGWWDQPGTGFLPAVTRATTVIVNPIVRTPWQVYKYEGAQMVPLPSPRWMTDPMMRGSVPGPNKAQFPWGLRLNSHEFWSTILTHAIWWGRGGFMAIEQADGQPLQGSMRIINPYMIALDDDGHWVIDPHGPQPLRTDFEGRVNVGGVTWRLYVMHGLQPNDPANPQGVLTRHFDTLRLGVAIHSFQHGQFNNGTPAGFLKVMTPNFDEEKAAKLKADWMEAHGGSKKSIAVLNAMVDFTPISISAVDAETNALKSMNLVDVAHMFGLSATWLDASAGYSLTYANAVDKRRELLDISLTGWGQQCIEAMNACFPDGTRVRIRWDMFTAPNLNEQIPVFAQAVEAGLLTVDEARLRMGLMAMGANDDKRQ